MHFLSSRLVLTSQFGLLLAVFASLPAQAQTVDSTSDELFQETLLPNEEKLISDAAEHAVALARKSRADGLTRRDAHAKHHGCIKGTFQVSSTLPENTSHGIFKAGKSYPVWARLSNSMPTVMPDYVPDGRGIALKLMNVDGPKLLESESDAKTQDFLLVSNPVFILRDLNEYNNLLSKPAAFLLTHPRSAFLVAKTVARPISDPLFFRYWSMTPSKLGQRAVKYSMRPCAGAASVKGTGENFLKNSMEKHLRSQDACFNFMVQFQKDETTMPVEDPSVEWNENVSPFVPVAKVIFPVQSFSSQAQQEFCENLSFTPWHSLTEHRPLGNLNRARKAVYEAMSNARHSDNGTLRAEPNGSESFNPE